MLRSGSFAGALDDAVQRGARGLDVLRARIFSTRFSVFLVGIVFLNVLLNGIWVIGSIEGSRQFSLNLFRNPFPEAPSSHYLLGSFLAPLLGSLTRLNQSKASFVLMHVGSLLLGLVALAYYVRAKFGDSFGRVLLLAFSTAPVSTCVLTWIGLDVYTFLCGSVLALADSVGVAFLASLLLGLNHFEQGLLCVLGIGVVRAFSRARKDAWVHVATCVLGLGLSKLFLSWFFDHYEFDLRDSRLGWASRFLAKDVAHLLGATIDDFVPRLFSFYYALWVLVAAFWIWCRNEALRTAIVAVNVVFALAAFITYDQTRVFAMISWPFIVACLVHLHRTERESFEGVSSLVFALFCAGILLPRIVVWAGKIHSSVLFHDVLIVLWYLGIVPDLPERMVGAPFK